MTAGPDVVLDDTIFDHQPGHADLHSDERSQINYLTERIQALIEQDPADPVVAALVKAMSLSVNYTPTPRSWLSTAWDFVAHPVGNVTIGILPDGRSVALTDLDHIAKFNAVSTAYSGPGTTVYVDVNTGSDTTGTGSSGNPYASWPKGQTVINTAGLPGKLHVIGGLYAGANRPSNTSVEPTVDTVVVLHGPTVVSAGGSSGADNTFTADTLYPKTYTITQANSTGVLLLDRQTRDGHQEELKVIPGRALTKGSTDTTKPSRITNAGGGDPNGVGFVAGDVGAGISGTGIPTGSVIASVQTVNAVFIVQGSTQALRSITTTSGSTTIGGTFTSADVGKVITGPGIPAQGASASVPNTIVSQTGTAAVIANAATVTTPASYTATVVLATAATTTVTDTSDTVALTLTGGPQAVNDNPGTTVNNGVKTYLTRGDGTVPSSTNTRSLRAQSDVLRLTKPVHYMIIGSDETASLEVQGGTNAGVNISITDFTAGPKLLIFAVPVSARYAAAVNGSTGRGWSINSWYGDVYAFSPDGSANATDGFNVHNANTRTASVATTNGSTAVTGTFTADMVGAGISGTGIPAGATVASQSGSAAVLSAAATASGTITATIQPPARGCRVVTFNRRGIDNGRIGQVSCQGGTSHEDVLWLDFAPTVERNHGGNDRHIGTTRGWCVAPNNADDRGDKVLSTAGLIDPVGFRCDDQSKWQVDRPNIRGPVNMLAMAATSLAQIEVVGGPPSKLKSYVQSGASITAIAA